MKIARILPAILLMTVLLASTAQARPVYYCYSPTPEAAGTAMEKAARTGIEEVIAARQTEPMERSLFANAEKKFNYFRASGFNMEKLQAFSDEFGFALFMMYEPAIYVKRTGYDSLMDAVTISLDVKAIDALDGKILGTKKASWTFTINKGIKDPADSAVVARAMRATAKKVTSIIADSEAMLTWILTH